MNQASSVVKTGTVNYVKSVRIPSYFGPYFLTLGLNTERHGVSHSIFSPNAGKC